MSETKPVEITLIFNGAFADKSTYEGEHKTYQWQVSKGESGMSLRYREDPNSPWESIEMSDIPAEDFTIIADAILIAKRVEI